MYCKKHSVCLCLVFSKVMDKAKRWGAQKCEGTVIFFQEWLVTAHNQDIDNNPLQSSNNHWHISVADIFLLTYILSKLQHTFINILPIVLKRSLNKQALPLVTLIKFLIHVVLYSGEKWQHSSANGCPKKHPWNLIDREKNIL